MRRLGPLRDGGSNSATKIGNGLMIMQHAAAGTIWCAGAVLVVLALNFLTERFPRGRAPAPHRRARCPRPQRL
jgi:hypothetical protein